MRESISLLIFTVMALFSACSLYEQPEIDNGVATTKYIDLQISIPGIETETRAIGAAEENAINSIDVLAFKINGTSETFDYAVTGTKTGPATGENGSEQSFKVTVQIQDYPQRFVVITNASSAVTTIVEGASVGANKSTMLAGLHLLLTGDNRWKAISATEYSAFPMWGESDPETITSSTTELANSIQMLRMVAKINVQLDQSNASVTDVFKLKSVHLYNTNTIGFVVPDSDNITGGKAIAPTIPTGDIRHTGPIEYTDFGAPGIENIAMRGAIYLFETAKDDAITDRLKATCVVIGGLYGSETEQSYYRVDFLKDNNFIDILRNHQYTINITKISGRGHDTVDEAFRAISINMEAEVVYWDEGTQISVTDGQYLLSVSEDEFVIYGHAKTISSTDNVFDVFTDHTAATPNWYVEKIVDAADGTTPAEWLTLSSTSGAANTIAQLSLLMPENKTGADRSAKIWFAAGRLRVPVTVTQIYTIAVRFARSNIVWDGSKLTFAVTPEDNATIPANIQGLFFKWGSLVAISPAALSGLKDGTYTADRWPNGHIIFSPSYKTTKYAYSAIPYANETTGVFGTHTSAEDDFANYYGNRRYNTGTNKGDICSYISDQGWVSGNWRLPLHIEYRQLINEQNATDLTTNGGHVSYNIGVTPPGTASGISNDPLLNGYGFYRISGRWFGKGASTVSSTANPPIGIFLPFTGQRIGNGESLNNNIISYYYTASSAPGTDMYRGLRNSSSTISISHTGARYFANPIRCIRVD